MTVIMVIAICLTSSSNGLSPNCPASYRVEARLDTATHELTGSEEIEFVNPTKVPLEKLCLHLYPNAFKDTSTVFCRENTRIRNEVASGNVSHLDVTNINVDGGAVSAGNIQQCGTLLYLLLPEALPSEKAITLSLNFELLIPRARMRFGYDESGNYLLSHCLPIICGYQEGRLVDWEYHSNGEFFSNFSYYDVVITVPAGFAIGTTGELIRMAEDSSTAVWHARADTVIDFAFAAGPNFGIFESDTLGINIKYLFREDRAGLFGIVDAITKSALAYNSSKFYPYPYKTLTVVDFPSGSSGMELPGMVVIDFPGGGVGLLRNGIINASLAHEVTHEWFYATVATNEFEEPWLDEGLTSYVTSRMLAAAGPRFSQFSLMGYEFTYADFERLTGLVSKAEWPIDLKSWDYPDFFSYDAAVYSRATLVFKTLDGLVGKTRFDSALTDFADTFRFSHPTGKDFKNFMATRTQLDLTRFYSQFIDGTARVDYSVSSLKYTPESKSGSSAAKLYSIAVTVGRELDGILPQTLVVGLQNGAQIDTSWDGAIRVATLRLAADSPPVYAAIDTGRFYSLDENLINNTLYIKSFGYRLLSFEWDLIFVKELILSLLL